MLLAQADKGLLNERLRRGPLLKPHRQNSPSRGGDRQHGMEQHSSSLDKHDPYRENTSLDRPISMAGCRLPLQPAELSHIVLRTFSCGLGGCGSNLSSPPEQAKKQLLPTKPHRHILGQAAHMPMPNSLTGALGSALLRIVRAQRAAGGPHRGLYPIPKPGRALKGAALQKTQAPTVATPRQGSGLPAQGLL